nr:IS66 family transposase [Haloplasma contractile]
MDKKQLESLNKDELIKYIEQMSVELSNVKEQLKLAHKALFGPKSEKTDVKHPEQYSLFNEAEVEADFTVDEPTVEEIQTKRVKRNPKRSREELFKELPVHKTIEYRLTEEERLCPNGHGPMKEISTEVTKELIVIPQQIKVVEHVRYVYGCEPCEKENINTPITTATMPNRVIPGSLAASSLIAFIMDKKYTNGMPLYRIEQEFKRYGIDLSRQNFSNWMIKGAEWLEHLYQRMYEVLIQKDIIHADETTVQVLHEAGKSATSKSYMWLYRSGRESNPIVLYDYQPSRSKEHPKRFLENFSGYLQVDGYQGYNGIPNVKLVGCFAHARRKFKEALDALPKDAKKARTTANKGFKFCNQLYKVEGKIKSLST